MKILRALPLLLAAIPALIAAGPAAPFSWRQTADTLALLAGGKVVWQFNWNKDLAQPYFHPVCLPDGTEITALSPPDHKHHRSLWFAWNKLNGVDYWSEPAGVTEPVSVAAQPRRNFSARIVMKIAYHPRAGGPAVLTETRTLEISRPDSTGRYLIDWRGEFTAGAEPVHMKGGTAGGGYAGLSVRIARNTRDWVLIDSEGRKDIAEGEFAKNTHGQRAHWMDFTLTGTDTGTTGGIAILEHPSSFRHPAQWHNLLNPKQPFGYFSPAPLWSEPYDLGAGGKLNVFYRVVVHPGRPSREQDEAEWKRFSAVK